MGVLKYRRIHRQTTVPNDDELELVDDEEDSYDEDYEPLMATSSSIGLPSTSTENPYSKAKAIAQEVMKKAPSKYAEKSLL